MRNGTFNGTFKSWVVPILSIIVKLGVLLSIAQAGQMLVHIAMSQPYYRVELDEIRSLFGAILFIMLSLELNYLLVEYAKQSKVDVRAVLIVLIIGYARKLLVMDLEKVEGITLFYSALVILAAGLVYWLICQCRVNKGGETSFE